MTRWTGNTRSTEGTGRRPAAGTTAALASAAVLVTAVTGVAPEPAPAEPLPVPRGVERALGPPSALRGAATETRPRAGVRGDGPVLVVTRPGDGFGHALCAGLLATEGLPACAETDEGNLARQVPLSRYRAVLLAAGARLGPGQVQALTRWVRAGGDVVAMRPDDALAPLLGLGPRTGTLSDAFLTLDTSRPPGAGLERAAMQFHGQADLRRPAAGVRAVARLGTSAAETVPFPAVTTRAAGAGTASAYAFDPARSVLLTRNGDPRLTGRSVISSDGRVRLADRFAGGFLDLDRAAVPQADQLMHLLTHQLLAAAPMPRLWYLPSYAPRAADGGPARAALVLTGDDHGSGSTTLQRFERLDRAAPAGCRPEDWGCPRATSYAMPGAVDDDDALPWLRRGFEVAPHPGDGTDCVPSGLAQPELDALARADLGRWRAAYPRTAAAQPPLTVRWHCYGSWSGYSAVPDAARAVGLTTDTSSACWPPEVFTVAPCLLTGTALPMPYADAAGRLTGVLQLTTQVTDENPATSSARAFDRMLGAAVGTPGRYGYYTVLAHLDGEARSGVAAEETLNAARRHGVAVISARQAAEFWSGRSRTRVTGVAQERAGRLHFTLASPVRGAELLLPAADGARTLRAVTRDGAPIWAGRVTLDGVRYWFVPDAAAGRWTATYR